MGHVCYRVKDNVTAFAAAITAAATTAAEQQQCKIQYNSTSFNALSLSLCLLYGNNLKCAMQYNCI
jgi:hypothetical protein